MTDPRHIVAVCGLFTNAVREVLLVKTPRRGWECPGGQVESVRATLPRRGMLPAQPAPTDLRRVAAREAGGGLVP